MPTAPLEACRHYRAELVIAKLDRLSRNLPFISALIDSGAEFVAVDNPACEQADDPYPCRRRRA
jgi:hypothetical protein